MSYRRKRARRRAIGVLILALAATLVATLWLTRERPLTETASARYRVTGKRVVGWIDGDRFLVQSDDPARLRSLANISVPAIHSTHTGGTYHIAELDDAWHAATYKASAAALWRVAPSPGGRTVLISGYVAPAAPTGGVSWRHYLLDVPTQHISEITAPTAYRAEWSPNRTVRLEFPGAGNPRPGVSPLAPFEFADWPAGGDRPHDRTVIPHHAPYEIALPPRSDGLIWTESGPSAWEQRMAIAPDAFEWRAYDPAHADRPAVSYTVKYPSGRRPAVGPFASRDGRRIAWVFEPYAPDTPTWQSFIAAVLARAGRRPPRRVEEIWTSSASGRDMQYMGFIEMSSDKEYIQQLLWLPDGARISFQRGGSLYVVSVTAHK